MLILLVLELNYKYQELYKIDLLYIYKFFNFFKKITR